MEAEKGDRAAQASYADACKGSFRFEEAVRWYRLAADQGLAKAQRELGQMLLSGQPAFPGRSAKVPADPVQAVNWLSQAAAQQDAIAMGALGRCYEEGRGVRVNVLQAYVWYSLAAGQGNIMAGVYRQQLVHRFTPDQLREGERRVAMERGRVQELSPARFVGISLKGISGSGQRPLALINNETFAVGETGYIKIGGRSVRIACLSIEKDAVIIRREDTLEKALLRLGAPPQLLRTASEEDDASCAEDSGSGLQVAPPFPRTSPLLKPAPKRIQSTEGFSSAPMPKANRVPPVPVMIAAAGGFLALAGIVAWGIAWRNRRDAEEHPLAFHRSRSGSVHKFSGARSAGHADLLGWFRRHAPVSAETSSESPSARDCSSPEDANESCDVAASSALTTTDLINRMRKLDWFQFEKVMAVLFRAHGYSVSRRGGANPDGGLDLVLTRDGRSYGVQCKHWKTWRLRVRTVREFLGALTAAGLPRGFLVTLARPTGEARNLAKQHGIECIDEAALRAMLGTLGAAGTGELLDALHDTRKLCPRCEAPMVLRSSTRGRDAGSQFWGCSQFPKCHYTMPVDRDAA